MRSEEVEKAIENVKLTTNTFLFGREQTIVNVNSIETLLSYISELEEKVEKYNKQLDLNYVDDNFISKDVIRDKIEHLKSFKGLVMYEKYNYEVIIRHLEELLGEENDN